MGSIRHQLGAVLLLLAALQASWSQATESAPPQPGSDVQNTMAQRMQACVICHGKEGRATNHGYFPRIAGKPAAYLYNQLQNFKAGLRQYQPMNHLVQHLSDDYLRDIAKYFSELDLPYPPARVTGLTAVEQRTAENLVRQGAPERGIPACTSCHGQKMAGALPAIPGLLTLPADYLVAQFGAWRTGQRRAMAPDCMADIAKRLSRDEVSVMAKWLAAQTLPLGTMPAPPATQPHPMRCGSDAP
jgi:cytochrome c553